MCEREIMAVAARQHNPGEALVVLEVHLSIPVPGAYGRREPIGDNTYRVQAVIQPGQIDIPPDGLLAVWDGDDEEVPVRPASGIVLEPIPPGKNTIVAYARIIRDELMLGTYLICRGVN